MGPWFVRDAAAPFRPGCSFETLTKMVAAGLVTADSVVRGPSTHQFWVRAARAAGVSRLLGVCHACGAGVGAEEYLCRGCGAALEFERDRQHLGLGETRSIPGRGPAAPVMTDRADAKVEPPAVAAGAAGAASAGQDGTAERAGNARHEGAMSARVARLERVVRRERRLRAMVISLCVVLIALLVVVVAGDRVLGGGDGGAVPGDDGSGDGAGGVLDAPDGREAVAGSDPATAGGAETAAGPNGGEHPGTGDVLDAGWQEIEAEILDPDTEHDSAWLGVQIARLEAMQADGTLPERGERLLEALRAERDRLGLRVLP